MLMLCLGQTFKRGEDEIYIYEVTTIPLHAFSGIRKDLLRYRAHSATSYHKNSSGNMHQAFGKKATGCPFETSIRRKPQKRALKSPKGKAGGVDP